MTEQQEVSDVVGTKVTAGNYAKLFAKLRDLAASMPFMEIHAIQIIEDMTAPADAKEPFSATLFYSREAQ